MNDFDQIFIEDLKCYATIGIFDWERQTKQPLIINLTLDISKIKNPKDHISDTVDYKSLSRKINDLVEKSSYQLIETLGIEIAKICLSDQKANPARTMRSIIVFGASRASGTGAGFSLEPELLVPLVDPRSYRRSTAV